ncbi:MAG: hypothetical protein V1691_03690 [Chloroflexota bacterium]
MFTRVRSKMHDPFGKKRSPEEEAARAKAAEKEAREEDTIVRQIASLEELVNRRTVELEEAKAQLNQLSVDDSPEDGEVAAKVEGFFSQPNQSKGAPADQPKVAAAEVPEAKEASTQPAKAETETTAEPPKKAEGPAPATEAAAGDDGISDLFGHDEEEENPLAGLITSLPDVSATELLKEADEIKAMMRELQPDKET